MVVVMSNHQAIAYYLEMSTGRRVARRACYLFIYSTIHMYMKIKT